MNSITSMRLRSAGSELVFESLHFDIAFTQPRMSQDGETEDWKECSAIPKLVLCPGDELSEGLKGLSLALKPVNNGRLVFWESWLNGVWRNCIRGNSADKSNAPRSYFFLSDKP